MLGNSSGKKRPGSETEGMVRSLKRGTRSINILRWFRLQNSCTIQHKTNKNLGVGKKRKRKERQKARCCLAEPRSSQLASRKGLEKCSNALNFRQETRGGNKPKPETFTREADESRLLRAPHTSHARAVPGSRATAVDRGDVCSSRKASLSSKLS